MEAVLFDLDGTLMDTSEGVIDSFIYVTKKMGYPDVPVEDVRRMIGTPVQKWFIDFFHIDRIAAQKSTDLFREYYLQHATTKANVYPGVYDLLDNLSYRKIKIAVATNKREDCALAMLENFGIARYCTSIHGADRYNKLKKFDIIDICLNEMDVDRQQVVLVGDTEHDALGAQQAGIRFIGVTYGLGFKNSKDVGGYACLAIVDSIMEVADLV